MPCSGHAGYLAVARPGVDSCTVTPMVSCCCWCDAACAKLVNIRPTANGLTTGEPPGGKVCDTMTPLSQTSVCPELLTTQAEVLDAKLTVGS